jgi:hypothetical protein
MDTWLIVTGPGAGNLDWRTVMDANIDTFRLRPDAAEEIYRNDSSPRWLFILNEEAFAKYYDRFQGNFKI